jgi:hypothetical protein
VHAPSRPWAGFAAAAAALTLAVAAQAFDPFLQTPDSATVEQSPAYKHANLAEDVALAELQARGVMMQREAPVRGVQTPIRLTGRLHGVYVHTALPDALRIKTPFEICDARLALALDDFAAILARHDIDEVIHYSMYRPGAPAQPPRRVRPGILPGGELPALPTASASGLSPVAAPAGSDEPHAATARAPQAARSRTRSQSEAAPPAASASPAAANASRHPAGLAIDAAKFKKRSGEWLDVATHFQGHIGARTCGQGAVVPADDKARELWSILCEVADGRVFTYVLSPNYNWAHRDHFHMEVKPGARWFLYH